MPAPFVELRSGGFGLWVERMGRGATDYALVARYAAGYVIDMAETAEKPWDPIAVIALIFGAAVIVPSFISLLLTLLAILGVSF